MSFIYLLKYGEGLLTGAETTPRQLRRQPEWQLMKAGTLECPAQPAGSSAGLESREISPLICAWGRD